MINEIDKTYMKRALMIASKGIGHVNPNPMVGAVIVKNGVVISEGYHMKYGEGHAEVNALKNAKDVDVSGATMYVTLEPCSHFGKTPPCARKIIEKKISRVVIGTLDPNPLVSGRGVKILQENGIDTEWGVLENECKQLNEIFMKYIVKKEPFVLIKYAMSLDGKITTYTGDSKWISCEESLESVHYLRNKYSSILVGINTVLKDNPMLTCRCKEGVNPVRIIVDSNLRIPFESNVVKTAQSIKTIVACTEHADKGILKKLMKKGIMVLVCKSDEDKRVCLKDLVSKIGNKGIDSILIEGGSDINFSAFKAEIVDKVRVYVAPKIIGGSGAKTPVGGIGVNKLSDAFMLDGIDYLRSGHDVIIEGYIKK